VQDLPPPQPDLQVLEFDDRYCLQGLSGGARPGIPGTRAFRLLGDGYGLRSLTRLTQTLEQHHVHYQPR